MKTYNKIKSTNLVLFAVSFSFIAVFGISLLTRNQIDSNIKQSSASAALPADINNDNVVNIYDLSILLANWNKTGSNTSDLTGDSVVNIFDLSLLLSKWGAVTPTSTPTPTPTSGAWMSGASGDDSDGIVNGNFGNWRGTPVAIAGTWNDDEEAQINQWSLQSGFSYGSWNKDIDNAIGAIWDTNGESWAKAATGSYDARWTTALNKIKTLRGSKTGTVHIRFAHEFNGDWSPWKVTGSDAANFVASWKRFRALQKSILPNAKLVFCPNDGSSSSLNLDWRNAFPGAAYVDEMGVDSYNWWPWVNTQAAFTSKINSTDGYGAPVGIEKHRLFAASVGLPLAIPEWSSRANIDNSEPTNSGDAPTYIKLFHDWVASHAGSGSGQVPYEILFNVGSFDNYSGVYQLYPTTHQPNAAAEYVKDF